MTNLAAVAPALLAHLRDDAMVLPELAPRVEQLAANLQQRLGKKPLTQWPRQMVPVLTTRFAAAYGELAFSACFPPLAHRRTSRWPRCASSICLQLMR